MTFSAEELITLTNQKQKMGMKETFVEKNQRIEVSIDTLAYLVMKKVDLEGMKVLMKDLYEVKLLRTVEKLAQDLTNPPVDAL